MNVLHTFLLENPVALLFLVVGSGYAVGRLRILNLDLGPVTGVLFTGLVFGSFGCELPPIIQTLGFVLFIFSVGLQAGPRFFSVLRSDGLRYLALSVVIAGTGLSLALAASRWIDFEPGAVGGLLAGGMTSTPTLAAAQEALQSGQIPIPAESSAEEMVTNLTTAYAITYLFGLIGLILIIRLLPQAMGVDFRAEAEKLAREQTGGVEDAVKVIRDIAARAYRVTEEEFTGVPLASIYERFPGLGALTRLRRDGQWIDVEMSTQARIGDEVGIVGFLDHLLAIGPRIGPEIHDPELLGDPIESCRVLVLHRKAKRLSLEDHPIGEITDRYGCFVASVERLGVEMPLGPELRLEAGDVLHLTGHEASLDRIGSDLGHVEREVDETDLVTLGLGIAVGSLIGGISIRLGGLTVGVGSAGGLLAAGLTIGYLRAIRPIFGRVPSAARWIFMELGLLVFMAGVGLRAGTDILDTLATSGASLFLAGALITSVPVFVGLLFGRYVLRIHPVMLLGAITGSMTSGAALSIVNREAGSSLPALGYTGAYAFANVLLTVAGSIILLL